MVFKRIADKPSIKMTEFIFSLIMPVNSSIEDDRLPEYMIREMRKAIDTKAVNVHVERVTRDGEGVIEVLKFSLK